MANEFQPPHQNLNSEQSTATGGRNTLISRGGKWHNLKRSLGQTKGGGDADTRKAPNVNGGIRFQDGDQGDSRSGSVGGAQLRDLNIDAEQARNGSITDNGYKDANGDTPRLHGIRQQAHEATIGTNAQNWGGEQEEQLPPQKILELASSPLTLPLFELSADLDRHNLRADESTPGARGDAAASTPNGNLVDGETMRMKDGVWNGTPVNTPSNGFSNGTFEPSTSSSHDVYHDTRPYPGARTVSTPLLRRRTSGTKVSGSSKDHNMPAAKARKAAPGSLRFEEGMAGHRLSAMEDPKHSPIPGNFPIPPISLPTYLQLELSSHRPSPTYIHRSASSDSPYESSRVKLERLQNFFLLPPQLERVLGFGTLACLDAWLYSFTILPLRFVKALAILGESLSRNLLAEMQFIGWFTYNGLGRMWRRKRRTSNDKAPEKVVPAVPQSDEDTDKAYLSGPAPIVAGNIPELKNDHRHTSKRRHRRNKSTPSALLPDHKADILTGLLIMLTCVIMMRFDPSRMYHGIRGQAAIKLYVIYNVLEVCDRLFAALGQDVLECLFSRETLERKSDGHSKILRPLWLFVLALAYNLIHATALFYQVITLNVAVNSYSNALLTLLMSNQFVEIKSTVFKRFEKENLFQITCADVVERFQLWLMLTIIASRNIVETGTLMPASSSSDDFSAAFLPKAFTLEIVPFLSGQVIGPYLIVLGSEMLVDWLKHAYITKFNMTKPAIYGRFLDVLCKDYYSNAFATQNLTRRIGLPVIPLACLFIRASIQTYHMFLATHVPSPLPPSSASTTIAVPAPTALFPEAVSAFLNNFLPDTPTRIPFTTITPDALLTLLTTALAFLLVYLALLACKLLLGIALLHFARTRYRSMKELEEQNFRAEGKRAGGWGIVEVDDEKKRWIYADDPDGLRKSQERENQARKPRAADGGINLMNVDRYSMVAKRIW